MTLYLVYGRSLEFTEYGDWVSCYGVFSSYEKAKAAKIAAEDNMYRIWTEQAKLGRYGISPPESRDEVVFNIMPMAIDTPYDTLLGGYQE